MAQRNFPYRREIRPASVESLGEHTDREFEKIETVLAAMAQRIAELEAQLAA